MKILFTSFSYYPETSGVPIVVQYLAEGLYARGHQVTVATRKNGGRVPSQELINGVNVVRFDCGQNLFKRSIGECDNYINFVINEPKDILIMECLQCHTTDILLPHLEKIQCKIIIHSHGAPGILMRPFGWEGDILHSIGHMHNWLRWKFYYKYTFPKYKNKIDAGICLSLCASDMEYLCKHLNDVYIAENAANSLFFDEAQYQFDISTLFTLKNKRYIVNISNYSDRKNQLLLMKSFAQSGINDVSLVLIGSKPNSYYDKCVRYANQLAKTHSLDIVLLHDIDRKFFPSIIHNADLFVMTSKWEEYPVSLVEAMAVGVPFLCTPVGNAHMLPGGVTSRCNEEIPFLLKILLRSPDILLRLSDQGKRYSSCSNSIGKVIEDYERIINKVVYEIDR